LTSEIFCVNIKKTVTGANAADLHKTTYGYNKLGQLKTETYKEYQGGSYRSQWDQTFTYDQAGNRTKKEYRSYYGMGSFYTPYTTNYYYNEANRLTEYKTNFMSTTEEYFICAYDASGNLTKKTDQTSHDYTDYEYDPLNRMTYTSGTRAGQGGMPYYDVSFTYDEHDRRIQKNYTKDINTPQPQNEITNFLWQGDKVVAEIMNESDQDYNYKNTECYTWGPTGKLEGVIFNRTKKMKSSSYTQTLQNYSAFRTTNYKGDVITTTNTSPSYDTFGKKPNGAAVNNGFGYSSEYHDAETGLQYLRARYYDPVCTFA